MELETTITDNGGSIYVRIPSAMVDYYGLRMPSKPLKCKIEDLSKNESKITFPTLD